ncbi:MAG: hypothetical protein ACU0FH_11925, partial [Heliomarina sp.]|uniref:hypothetical protein n=1 Tax=Heliomarina sp. TaxID=2917556 RepID=UPI004058266D
QPPNVDAVEGAWVHVEYPLVYCFENTLHLKSDESGPSIMGTERQLCPDGVEKLEPNFRPASQA